MNDTMNAARKAFDRAVGKAQRNAAKAMRDGVNQATVIKARDRAIDAARLAMTNSLRNAKRASSPMVRKPPRDGSLAVLGRVDGEVRSIPKEPRLENPHLLDMAKGGSCLFLWRPGCYGPDGSTTVQCHENSLDANKGLGYKAHDFRSARGCYVCHSAYDQPQSSSGIGYAERVAAFESAFRRQIAEWQAIASSPAAKPKDRNAAAWAIDNWSESSMEAINV